VSFGLKLSIASAEKQPSISAQPSTSVTDKKAANLSLFQAYQKPTLPPHFFEEPL
jgi:hypothetical protein